VTDLRARQGTDFAVTLTLPVTDGEVAAVRMIVWNPARPDADLVADLTLATEGDDGGIADVNGVYVAAAAAAATAHWPAGDLRWEAKVRFGDSVLDIDDGILRVTASRIGADV
jgi:hypothetical protein